jgi:hypothetical protein
VLKLTYTRKRDKFQTVTVLGDAAGIRDLYWQLTHNYKAQDGTEIGEIKVTNLEGLDCTRVFFQHPHGVDSQLSTLES